MYKIEQLATVSKGKLELDKDRFRGNLSLLQDGDYVLVLEKIRTDRTPEEWQKEFGAWLSDFCKETGHDRRDRDLVIRPMIYQACLPQVYNNPEHINIPLQEITELTTMALTVAGWRAFMNCVRCWMWSTGNYII